MRVESDWLVHCIYEPAPKHIDKCLMITPAMTCVEGDPKRSVFGRDYLAWCKFPKIDKKEIERVKREYTSK